MFEFHDSRYVVDQYVEPHANDDQINIGQVLSAHPNSTDVRVRYGGGTWVLNQSNLSPDTWARVRTRLRAINA